MQAVKTHPLVSPDQDSPAVHAARPSRLRPIVAALLLIVMGLLVAASVLASRPYQPAAHPRATTSPAQNGTSSGQHPDPC